MILLALVLFAAQPEQPVAPASPDPQPAAAASKAMKTSDRDRVVCRASTQTGRHIVDRVCHTQSEWHRMETGGKAYADFATHGQNGCPGSTGGHC